MLIPETYSGMFYSIETKLKQNSGYINVEGIFLKMTHFGGLNENVCHDLRYTWTLGPQWVALFGERFYLVEEGCH